MDRFDKKILAALQDDAAPSLAALAERVGLSPSPCWRRVQALEAAGVIRKRVALLDRARLNVGVTAFVAVRTNQHNAQWYERFAKAVEQIPEIVEFYRMSGEIDYLLRVVVPDIAAYDDVYKRLTSKIELYDVSSSFAMEEIKYTTAIPLDYLEPADRPPTTRARQRR